MNVILHMYNFCITFTRLDLLELTTTTRFYIHQHTFQQVLYLLNLSRCVLEEIKLSDIPVYVCALLKPSSRLITRLMTSKHTASTRSTKHTCIEVAYGM